MLLRGHPPANNCTRRCRTLLQARQLEERVADAEAPPCRPNSVETERRHSQEALERQAE